MRALLFTVLAAILPLAICRADGLVVEKVYHPYVDALETEIEFRSVFQDPQPAVTNKAQIHQFSIGHAIGMRTFAEVYLVGGKDRASGFETEAWEVEVKRQLTEQGEFAVDWGVLFEYERELRKDIQEFTIGLLGEKELGNWSLASNLFLIREWGDDISSEFETAFNTQLRYRYSRFFEPAIEFYAGQNTRSAGPVVQGNLDLGQRKNLHWEAGLILGLDDESADKTWRFLFEYEF